VCLGLILVLRLRPQAALPSSSSPSFWQARSGAIAIPVFAVRRLGKVLECPEDTIAVALRVYPSRTDQGRSLTVVAPRGWRALRLDEFRTAETVTSDKRWLAGATPRDDGLAFGAAGVTVADMPVVRDGERTTENLLLVKTSRGERRHQLGEFHARGAAISPGYRYAVAIKKQGFYACVSLLLVDLVEHDVAVDLPVPGDTSLGLVFVLLPEYDALVAIGWNLEWLMAIDLRALRNRPVSGGAARLE
jgi:hypothetical protein